MSVIKYSYWTDIEEWDKGDKAWFVVDDDYGLIDNCDSLLGAQAYLDAEGYWDNPLKVYDYNHGTSLVVCEKRHATVRAKIQVSSSKHPTEDEGGTTLETKQADWVYYREDDTPGRRTPHLRLIPGGED